jgi:hypothetical protein
MTPEDAAAALLVAVGHAGLDAIPIDVLQIAEEHDGLDVQEHADLLSLPGAPSLSPDALSGLLFPGPRRIYVNAIEARRSPGRKNFTIAHELGHWHLHHDASELGQRRFCRADDVGGDARALRESIQLEREANQFAAALLMPAPLVRRCAADLRLNVRVLAARFGVSVAAMQVRLETLRLLPDYMLR